MTNSAIEQVLQRGLWWHCDDDVTGLTWFNAALEYHIMRHRCRLVNTEMKMHRLDSDPTGLIQYGQESWDDQHGWLEEGR